MTENTNASTSPRWHVRAANPCDYPAMREMMRELELEYPSMDLARFFVGEREGEIVAAAELKDLAGFCLLSCVGVRESLQGTGLGRALVEEVAGRAHHDIYLYTLVPEFFRRCGFAEIQSPPEGVPGRWLYGCVGCDPTRCLCMVRKADVPRVS